MLRQRLAIAFTLTAGGALPMACRDSSASPTGPAAASATSSAHGPAAAASPGTAPSSAQHSMHDAAPTLGVVSPTPFTYRGAIDPYQIRQLPEFVARSTVRSDIVMQQSVFNPGAGPWHTHPGPSFIYVIQGQIKLQRAGRTHRCSETPVYSPGSVYTESADQVHRAVVVSAEPAVVMVTRFNIPIGSPLTIPAADPECKWWSAPQE